MQIFNQDIELFEEDRECSYFKEYLSDIKYKYVYTCDIEKYYKMLERGWRRFGRMHFVPECKSCNKCISMRIDVKNYNFSKSDKRIMSKNKNTNLIIQKPSITREHLNLYDRYHKFMKYKKKWPYIPIKTESYISSYVEGSESYAKEFLFMKNDKLIGVSLVDILPKGISSIYCYYDHDYEGLSIGKFSILLQIKIAKELDIPYIYLGYWIKDHFSMGYKEKYQPFEILKNRPSLNEEPIWEKYYAN